MSEKQASGMDTCNTRNPVVDRIEGVTNPGIKNMLKKFHFRKPTNN